MRFVLHASAIAALLKDDYINPQALRRYLWWYKDMTKLLLKSKTFALSAYLVKFRALYPKPKGEPEQDFPCLNVLFHTIKLTIYMFGSFFSLREGNT